MNKEVSNEKNLVEMLSKTSEIRERMIDEVSKKMFDLRVKYSIDHDRDELIKEHFILFDKGWYVHELDEIMELNSNPNEICILVQGNWEKKQNCYSATQSILNVTYFLLIMIESWLKKER